MARGIELKGLYILRFALRNYRDRHKPLPSMSFPGFHRPHRDETARTTEIVLAASDDGSYRQQWRHGYKRKPQTRDQRTRACFRGRGSLSRLGLHLSPHARSYHLAHYCWTEVLFPRHTVMKNERRPKQHKVTGSTYSTGIWCHNRSFHSQIHF